MYCTIPQHRPTVDSYTLSVNHNQTIDFSTYDSTPPWEWLAESRVYK